MFRTPGPAGSLSAAAAAAAVDHPELIAVVMVVLSSIDYRSSSASHSNSKRVVVVVGFQRSLLPSRESGHFLVSSVESATLAQLLLRSSNSVNLSSQSLTHCLHFYDLKKTYEYDGSIAFRFCYMRS